MQNVQIRHTAELDDAALAAVRALCDAAFEGDFSDARARARFVRDLTKPDRAFGHREDRLRSRVGVSRTRYTSAAVIATAAAARRSIVSPSASGSLEKP